MLKITLKFTAIFLFMATPILSFSQDGSGFEQFIKKTFENEINAISKGKNPSDFLNSFSESLVWVNLNVSIDGRVSGKKNDKEKLNQTMNMLQSRPNLDIVWEIESQNTVQVRENTRMSTFEVKVTMYASGEVISSGKNMIEVIARKMNDKFYVNYFSIIQISDKTYKGRCFVDSKKNKAYYV